MTVQLKVKRLRPEAILPTKAHATDAAWDIYLPKIISGGLPAVSIQGVSHSTEGNTEAIVQYRTGLAFDIPVGHFIKLETRSGLATAGYSVRGGIIDSGYTGEVIVCLAIPSKAAWPTGGDRIAQAILYKLPDAVLIEVDELPQTERGANGFGSTGK